MKTLRLLADNLEEFVAVALVLTIGSIMAMQVFLRTVFDAPLSWPEELSQFFMVWAALFGGIGALKRSELIRVDLVERLLPTFYTPAIRWAHLAMTFVLLGAVLLGGYELAGRTRMQTASMPFTWYWAYIAAPVFSLCAALRLVQKILCYEFVLVGSVAPVLERAVSEKAD